MVGELLSWRRRGVGGIGVLDDLAVSQIKDFTVVAYTRLTLYRTEVKRSFRSL
jgi:hypothetical protein